SRFSCGTGKMPVPKKLIDNSATSQVKPTCTILKKEQAFRPVPQRVHFLVEQARKPVPKKLIDNSATSPVKPTCSLR
ncbi:MAG: hypothetical protein WCF82_10805, partial [Microcoleus sp.]